MSPTEDLMAWSREGLAVASEQNLETIREGKEAIQGPAVGRKLEKQERLAQHRALIENPNAIAALGDALSAQYQLTPEKPISRRLVSRLLRAHRELAAEEEENG